MKIRDNHVEIRDKKGKLRRKINLEQEKNDHKNPENNESDKFLSKMGLLNSNEVTEHNLDCIYKRKSPYPV